MTKETLNEAIEAVENLVEQLSCDITEAAVVCNMAFESGSNNLVECCQNLSHSKMLHGNALNILNNLRNMSKYAK
jgi:hypothetical protein